MDSAQAKEPDQYIGHNLQATLQQYPTVLSSRLCGHGKSDDQCLWGDSGSPRAPSDFGVLIDHSDHNEEEKEESMHAVHVEETNPVQETTIRRSSQLS